MGDGVTTSVGCGVGIVVGGFEGTEVGSGVGCTVVGRGVGRGVGALEGLGVGGTVVGAEDGERDGSGVNSCMIVNSTSFISTFWPYPPSSGSTVPDPPCFCNLRAIQVRKEGILKRGCDDAQSCRAFRGYGVFRLTILNDNLK